MASKKSTGGGQPARQHYDYARTGTVPGVGSIGGKSTAEGMAHKHGGKVHKPRGRGK